MLKRKTRRNRTLRKLRNQKAGKVIGKGVFGCVTDPPIQCPGAPTNAPYVSKLYDPFSVDPDYEVNSTYITEYDKAQEMRRRIPSIDNYMLLPVFECATNLADLPTAPNFQDCRTIMGAIPSRILYFPRANGNLDQLYRNTTLMEFFTANNRLQAIADLLLALQLLHEAGITHNDAHAGNILYIYDEATQSFKLRLADIGLALFDQEEDMFDYSVHGDIKKLGNSVFPLASIFSSDPSLSAFFRAWRGGSFRTAANAYTTLRRIMGERV